MEPTPIIEADRPPEHSFGKIHEITVPVEWARNPKNPRKKVRGFVPATTTSWSVNGVGFTTADDPLVEVGDALTLRIGPVTGEVIVRSIRPEDVVGRTYYGVEFIDDDLQGVARDLIAIHLRHNPEEHVTGGSPLDIDDPNRGDLKAWM